MGSSIDIKLSNFFPLIKNVLKWHWNYYLKNKPSPLIAQFYTTHKCNFRCEMCNFWRNPRKTEIPLDKFKEIISDLKDMGCCFVNFTGGEPLILKDMIQRISYAKKKIPYVHMVSNGFLIDEKMAKKINKTGIDSISISINAIGKNYDKLTNVKGSFDKALNALKNLKKFAPNVKPSMNSLITPTNTKELYKLTNLGEKLGVDHKFQAVIKHPVFEKQNTIKEKNDKNASVEDIEEVKKFINFIKKKKHILNSNYYLSRISDSFLSKIDDSLIDGPLFDEKCKFPYYFCEFKDNGEVSPCLTGTWWEKTFSVLNNSLKTIYYSKEFKAIQDKLYSCKRCKTDMQVCTIEPRTIFPISNFVRFKIKEFLEKNFSFN